MLVIRQSDCIDCGICEPECPVEAIVPDSHPKATMWIDLNQKFSETWPNITLERHVIEAGVTYVMCQIAFGDLPLAASLQTISFMRSTVMPALS
jgi:ferredoxin